MGHCGLPATQHYVDFPGLDAPVHNICTPFILHRSCCYCTLFMSCLVLSWTWLEIRRSRGRMKVTCRCLLFASWQVEIQRSVLGGGSRMSDMMGIPSNATEDEILDIIRNLDIGFVCAVALLYVETQTNKTTKPSWFSQA